MKATKPVDRERLPLLCLPTPTVRVTVTCKAKKTTQIVDLFSVLDLLLHHLLSFPICSEVRVEAAVADGVDDADGSVGVASPAGLGLAVVGRRRREWRPRRAEGAAKREDLWRGGWSPERKSQAKGGSSFGFLFGRGKVLVLAEEKKMGQCSQGKVTGRGRSVWAWSSGGWFEGEGGWDGRGRRKSKTSGGARLVLVSLAK